MEQRRKELLVGRIEKQAQFQAVGRLISKLTRPKPKGMPVYKATLKLRRASPLRAARPSATAASRVSPKKRVATSADIAKQRAALPKANLEKLRIRQALKKTAMVKLLKKLAGKKQNKLTRGDKVRGGAAAAAALGSAGLSTESLIRDMRGLRPAARSKLTIPLSLLAAGLITPTALKAIKGSKDKLAEKKMYSWKN